MIQVPPDLEVTIPTQSESRTESGLEVPEVVAKWRYQDEHCVLVPYSPNSVFQFPEDFLVSIYCRLRDQGWLQTIFPGMERLTLNRFVHYFHDKPMVVSLAKPTYNVAGIGWLYDADGYDGARIATLGFGFFREAQGTPVTLASTRLALRWWFEELKVDVLYGQILESNRMAQNFSRKLGFRSLCTMPRFVREGQLLDARLVMLTKEEFLLREASDGRRRN